jgi:hypothetical protein
LLISVLLLETQSKSRGSIIAHLQIYQNGHKILGFGFMVFNATFNNISVISNWSVLLVEETGGPGENHWPVASHWQTLLHNVVSSTPRPSKILTHVSGDKHWLHR